MPAGCPMLTTRISAFLVMLARSCVYEWQIVTVASRRIKTSAAGLPPILLRPTTTAWRPAAGIPASCKILRMTSAVEGMKLEKPSSKFPALREPRPSTSFSGSKTSVTMRCRICSGNGRRRMTPSMLASPLMAATSARSSSSSISNGYASVAQLSPISRQERTNCLL